MVRCRGMVSSGGRWKVTDAEIKLIWKEWTKEVFRLVYFLLFFLFFLLAKVFPHSYCTSWCEYATRAPTVGPVSCAPAPRPPRQFGGMQGATPWPSMASRKLGCLRLARVLRYAPHPAAERPISVLHPLTSPHLGPHPHYLPTPRPSLPLPPYP